MFRVPATLIALGALMTSLAACGSSVTRSDYVARANAICAQAVRQTRVIPPPAPATGSVSGAIGLSALAGYVERITPIAEHELSQLEALKRPSGGAAADRSALSRYFVALAAAIRDYRDLGAAAARGDAAGMRDAEAALAGSHATELAVAYGLRACGTPGGTGVR